MAFLGRKQRFSCLQFFGRGKRHPVTSNLDLSCLDHNLRGPANYPGYVTGLSVHTAAHDGRAEYVGMGRPADSSGHPIGSICEFRYSATATAAATVRTPLLVENAW